MAQQLASVRVKGYREVVRGLKGVDDGTRKALLDGLKKAADPIAQDARGLLSRYQGLRTSTIRPRATAGGVFVTQGARKKTGLRPDFGALQMRVGLIPALHNHDDDIHDRVDDALDALIRREGF